MKTSIIYIGFGSDNGINSNLFYKYGLNIGFEIKISDVSKLRFLSRVAFEYSDGVIFVYSGKYWPDLQKIMLIEFERSSVFVESDRPYVVAKGFRELGSGIFFDYVYNKPIIFLPFDVKEDVDLRKELLPFSSDRVLVRVFDENLSKSEFCIYHDEVESILSVPKNKIKSYNAYTNSGETPEESLFEALRERGEVKIATAESCTAGLVAARIANVPGISEFLEGGVITYSNKLKVNVVKVNSNLLYRVGAVSEEVAYQMATGALGLTSADYAVSVTGIAGPGGATPTKPVGLVYFGFASKNRVIVKKKIFKGNRRIIRDKSSRYAILMLRKFLLEE